MIAPTGYRSAAAEFGADASADEPSLAEVDVVSTAAAPGVAHVLVGIDGSAESLIAFRWAERFAAATGRRLHLAHAWQHARRHEFLTTPVGGDPSSLEADVVARLRQFAREQAVRPALVIECWALRGDVAGAIRKQAAQSGADMIVVGARGEGGALRAMLGSTARQLTACPSRVIAVVPGHSLAPKDDSERIVVGVDGSAGSSRALRWAGATAKESGAEVVVIHAFEPPESDLTPRERSSALDEAKSRLEVEWCAPLRDLGVRHRAVVEAGAARFVIQRTADAERPVCVVVGSRGLGALSQRLLGSVTYHLVRRLDWPTVIVPSPRDCIVWSE